MSSPDLAVFWFRRDLRLEDNHALFQALEGDLPVLPLFIFDRHILDRLEDEKDARVLFIWQEVKALKRRLEKEHGSSMLIYHGKPEEVWHDIIAKYSVKAVYVNRDYDPYGRERDKSLYLRLKERGIAMRGYKDQVLFEKDEILKDDGSPYVVYTPYMKKYKSAMGKGELPTYPSEKGGNYWQLEPLAMPELEEMGFRQFDFQFPDREINEALIRTYDQTRDIPAKKGTTRLSLHLRFGTISLRRLATMARKVNQKFFNELIWRDFYQAILYHYPSSMEASFRPEYDGIAWENNAEHYQCWCEGKTGYPLVDAGMRELNSTGFMHNRVRMVTASFLCKHLLIDWRWGEAYFARKLLDYEAASNVGGWQWAAGSGVDAAPYFRVFNPSRQQERFDPQEKYIRKWVPEYGTAEYPAPIVEHKWARERALDRYKKALKN